MVKEKDFNRLKGGSEGQVPCPVRFDEISRASCNVRTNYGSGVIMAKEFAY